MITTTAWRKTRTIVRGELQEANSEMTVSPEVTLDGREIDDPSGTAARSQIMRHTLGNRV